MNVQLDLGGLGHEKPHDAHGYASTTSARGVCGAAVSHRGLGESGEKVVWCRGRCALRHGRGSPVPLASTHASLGPGQVAPTAPSTAFTPQTRSSPANEPMVGGIVNNPCSSGNQGRTVNGRMFALYSHSAYAPLSEMR